MDLHARLNLCSRIKKILNVAHQDFSLVNVPRLFLNFGKSQPGCCSVINLFLHKKNRV